jgi:putative ATPase
VYIMKNLEMEHLAQLIERACAFLNKEHGIAIEVRETEALMRISGGDARKLMNALELVVQSSMHMPQIIITNELVVEVVQQNIALYDKSGEQHYDIISAFIKSIRGSDPNAAVYWLARMIEGGEDPKFIARRMLILASEDIGNANPNALLLATSCFEAVHMTGYPECRIILSQVAVYLACSEKSNASYMAVEKALEEVRSSGNLSVPLHVRNAPTKLMKDIGYSKGYKYAHSYEGNFTDMEFLPDKIHGMKFYEPGQNSREIQIRERLKSLWKDKYKY